MKKSDKKLATKLYLEKNAAVTKERKKRVSKGTSKKGNPISIQTLNLMIKTNRGTIKEANKLAQWDTHVKE